MMRVCATVLALAATPVAAAPDRLSVLLGSQHLGAPGQFEEANPGLFLTWEREPLDWSVGVYRNSYGRTSAAVTAALPVLTRGEVELSLFAGVALYPGDGRRFAVHAGDVVPIGGVQIRAGHLFGQIIPSDGHPVDAIVSFGLTFDLQ